MASIKTHALFLPPSFCPPPPRTHIKKKAGYANLCTDPPALCQVLHRYGRFSHIVPSSHSQLEVFVFLVFLIYLRPEVCTQSDTRESQPELP